MRRQTLGSAATAALLLFFAASPAAAQGKGRGLGKSKKSSQQAQAGQPGGGGGGEEAPSVPGTGIRHFGVWLDDATVSPKGKGWVTVGVGYWKSTFAHSWDAPSVDLGLGVARGVQVAVTAPFSRVSYTDGTTLRGLGDTYMSAKVALVEPGVNGRPWGVAVAPVVEILSSGSVEEGSGRVHWVLPVTVEWRFNDFRAYGAVGYFSRGAVFGSTALELPLTDTVTGIVSLSHSRSLEEDLLSDALGLSKNRWDLGVGLAYAVASNATAYGTVGRTLSRLDQNATSVAVNAGVSLGFQRRPPRR